MSIRKVKQIIAVKVTGYIELPQKDVKAAAAILNTFVAAQDSGDYSELFKMMTVEKVDANQVRRTFEVDALPEVENHELVPVGATIHVALPRVGEAVVDEEAANIVVLDDGTVLNASTGEVIEAEIDEDVPAFAKKFA